MREWRKLEKVGEVEEVVVEFEKNGRGKGGMVDWGKDGDE